MKVEAVKIFNILIVLSLGFVPLPSSQVEPPNPEFVSTNGTIVVIDEKAEIFTAKKSSETKLIFDSCSIPSPTLNSPTGGVEITTLTPDFYWSGTSANYYQFQLSDDNFATSIYIYDILLMYPDASTVNFFLPENLEPNTDYYWRVASVCDDYSEGAFSSPAPFETGDISGPFIDPPAMISPNDGSLICTGDVEFVWEDISGATGWQLRLYTTYNDALNDEPWSYRWSIVWTTSTIKNIEEEGTFYWRIQARDDVAWGDLSSIRSFTLVDCLFLPIIMAD